jgi:hypothetical protein
MYRLLSVPFLLILITSCSTNDNKNELIEEITFTIDDSKLSEIVVNDSLQVKFRAPKNWKALGEKQTIDFIANMDSLNLLPSDISIKPKHVFIDSSANCFLMVHSVSLSNESLDDNDIEAFYESYLSERLGEQLLRRGRFNKEGTLMTQYVMKDGARIIFKLFFKIDRDRLVQFDYFILSNYEQEIKAIESSIGSITKQ